MESSWKLLSRAVYEMELTDQLISGDVHEFKWLGQLLGQQLSETVC